MVDELDQYAPPGKKRLSVSNSKANVQKKPKEKTSKSPGLKSRQDKVKSPGSKADKSKKAMGSTNSQEHIKVSFDIRSTISQLEPS